MHEALSLATLLALAVHGLALIGDGYVHLSVGDVAVPFLSGFKPLWTSMGIVASWMVAALGLSTTRASASGLNAGASCIG